MLKDNKKTLIITSIVTLLPALIGIFLWNRLPDVMATHFGLDNEADGFSSKIFAVFGLPLFCLALLWMCAWATSRDPRKKNISPKIMTLVLWLIPAVSIVAAVFTYSYNLGMGQKMDLIMGLLCGFLFIVIGNYLPKTRQNYTIGIRIPWTLENEDNWNRTHRFAGFLWVAGGIFMVIMAFTGLAGNGLLIGFILVISLIPCIYSYLLCKKAGTQSH
jgi:uncharacterized membrane protein